MAALVVQQQGLKVKIDSIDEQRELFLWRFKDVDRGEVTKLFHEFVKHDLNKRGELDYHETMMLLEHRGMTMTANELSAMVSSMDFDHNRMIDFLELCCGLFKKSFEELNDFADEEARAVAIAAAMKLGDKAKEVELAIELAKQALIDKEIKKAEEIEAESHLSGVKGRAAFFKRQAENTGDVTKSNEQRIKEEAARRKDLREAKAKLNEALLQASKQQSPEEIAEEIRRASAKAASDALEAELKIAADEKAARAARKAALNAKWEKH